MANTNTVQRFAGQLRPGIGDMVNRPQPAWLTKLLMQTTPSTNAQPPAAGQGTPLTVPAVPARNGFIDMTPQMRERIQKRRQQTQPQTGIANPKMAEARSAARLASLQKVAAEDRSAKRLETLKKCAERNFVKASEARSELRRLALLKCAGVASDVGATLPTYVAGQIPLLGILPSLAGMGGSIGGLVVKPKGDKNPETQASSLIPGVGQFRLAQRSRRMADMSERAGKPGIANLIAEKLGPMTSSLVGAGAGALGGLGLAAAAGGDSTAKGVGAGVGAGVGVAAPLLIAALVAAIKRRRTNAEQIASDTTGRAVAKYLVPGLATYDDYKRLGASGNNDEKKASVSGDALLAMSRGGKKLVGGLSGALAGGVAGAGAGGLYGLAGIVTDKEKRKKWLRTLLGSAALGAGAGAVGGGYYGQGVGPLTVDGIALAAARNEKL